MPEQYFPAYHKDAECFECKHSKTALTMDGDVWQICFIQHDKTVEQDCIGWELQEKEEPKHGNG